MSARLYLPLVLVFSFLCVGASLADERRPAVRVSIEKPSAGTVVKPGGVLTVRVDASPTVRSVLLSSDLFADGVSFDALVKDQKPFVFRVRVPEGVELRRYSIVAVARVSKDEYVESKPVDVVVLGREAPTSITAEPSDSLSFRYRGQSEGLTVTGTMPDGQTARFGAGVVQCVSTMPGVVAVTEDCRVVAITNGQGTIVASVGDVQASIDVDVSVPSMAGDLDADDDVDIDDENTLLGEIELRETPAPTGDDRDINADGKLDALDISALKALCTRPQCAVEP